MNNLELIRFDGFELDPGSRSLKRDGKEIALSPKTFDLLMYLAWHPQRVISKDELIAAVWPNSFVEESNLSQHIFLLRRSLAATGTAARVVVTVPGRGYLFSAEVETTNAPGGLVMHASKSVTHVTVEEDYEEDHEEDREEVSRVATAGAAGGRRYGVRFWGWVALAVAVVMGGSAAAWLWLRPAPAGHVDVVLAGIANTTGDADFDRTLNQALQIDLEQTPFLNLLSRLAIQETLAQMQQPRAERLTPELAREVCERNNAQATLSGTISRVGGAYVLILRAESCISGKQLAGAKAQVSQKEAVLGALDRVAGQVRRQLGESAASREQYRMPIAEATTPSFEALLAYTQAGESFRHGDMKAAQVLLERAIALDPNFASAYRILASSYYNLGDYGQAAAYYKKAFDLRERTTERERLGIEVMYYGYALNDSEESIRRTRQFLAIYPNVANSWVSLCNLYDRLGQYPEAIDAAKRAIALEPHSGVAAVELMRAQMRLGLFAEAKATARTAMADGKDHWDLHSMLFQMAFAERDSAAETSEGEWGLTHQHVNIALKDLAEAAAAGGRLQEAMQKLTRARDEARRNSERDFENGAALLQAEMEAELGHPAEAKAALKAVKEEDGDPSTGGRIALLEARVGEPGLAGQFVTRATASESRNTLNNFVYLPLVRAALALGARKPAEALKDLEPARAYQLADFKVPYLRAEAEVAAGMPDAAIADYRMILAHSGVDPISPLYSLAHFQLATVLAKQGQTAAAQGEYRAFLEGWRDADAEEPLKRQAGDGLRRLH